MSLISLDDMTEPELAAAMKAAARAVERELPPATGFIILAFPFGAGGVAQYIANCDRSTRVRMLRETADRLEQKEDVPR
jgi:hypothetical protein